MKKKPVKSPPKWADRFLAWYCNPKLLEQIQGDVHELYYWRIKEKGGGKARRSFIWDVLRLFKWSNIKRSNKSQNRNNMGIFKNYFKIGLRNLWKQRMPSAINIIGLSLAIGCSIVAFKFVEYNYVKDDFHENKDDLFLVTHWEELESNKGRNGGTDNQLVGEILKSVPGIKTSTRYNYRQPEVRYGIKTKYEAALFVDEAFMDIFSFDLLYGNPNTLYNEGEIIIDESTSISLFGDANPVGKKVDLKIRENWKTFTIGAVYRDKPNNSSIQINMLVNYVHYEQEFRDRATWNTNLFIQREDGVEPASLLSAMDQLLPVYNKDNEETAITYFELEPLSTMANNSYEMMNGVGSGPNMAPIITLSAIGVFMLILSTLNYVNISLAMIMKRLKEIGIRKVIGSKRKQLVTQFLIENFLLCAFSMFLGVLLAHSFFLPGFNEIAGGDFKLDLWSHLNFWYFLIG
ncbi:MAG: ABC transporter permease, partial [Roseivirga sp.]|nr:ABC transporter permease [Roseivirga sp.]